jgi:hypothetical protein
MAGQPLQRSPRRFQVVDAIKQDGLSLLDPTKCAPYVASYALTSSGRYIYFFSGRPPCLSVCLVLGIDTLGCRNATKISDRYALAMMSARSADLLCHDQPRVTVNDRLASRSRDYLYRARAFRTRWFSHHVVDEPGICFAACKSARSRSSSARSSSSLGKTSLYLVANNCSFPCKTE